MKGFEEKPNMGNLRAIYPKAPDAVELCEKALSYSAWEEYHQSKCSPKQIVVTIKVGLASAVLLQFEKIKDIPAEEASYLARALDQMDRPEFLCYVAAKLGAM